LTGNDVAFDFVRALTDDHQRGVSDVALEVGRLPHAAVDADRVDQNLYRGVDNGGASDVICWGTRRRHVASFYILQKSVK